MNNIDRLLSEQRIQSLFGDKPTPRKITCNEGRPCVVYTSEVFSTVKDFMVYLNQTTGKTK